MLVMNVGQVKEFGTEVDSPKKSKASTIVQIRKPLETLR